MMTAKKEYINHPTLKNFFESIDTNWQEEGSKTSIDAINQIVANLDTLNQNTISIDNEIIKYSISNVVSWILRYINTPQDLFKIRDVFLLIQESLLKTIYPDNNTSAPHEFVEKLSRVFDLIFIQLCIHWTNRSSQTKIRKLLESNKTLSIEKELTTGILEAVNIPIFMFNNDHLKYLNIAAVNFVNNIKEIDPMIDFGNLNKLFFETEAYQNMPLSTNAELIYNISINQRIIEVSAMQYFSIDGSEEGLIVTIGKNIKD